MITSYQKRDRIVRIVVLAAVLFIISASAFLHQHGSTFIPAGIDAFCPFGALESAYTFIASKGMIQRIELSSFILFGAMILTLVLFRRIFCGHICPLGFLQEIFGKIGSLFVKKPVDLPSVIDKPARYLKYLVLVFFIVWTWIAGTLVMRPYDPWVAYAHIFEGFEAITIFPVAFAILFVTLISSLFVSRPFCKYLCPLGAFLGIVNRIGLFRVARNESSCINCLACDTVCPTNIKVSESHHVNSSECINCHECVNVCPVEKTLEVKGPAKMQIRPIVSIIATVVLFAGVIGVTTAMGSFKPFVGAGNEITESTGGFDPATIRGRQTFSEVSALSGVPKEKFIQKFGITEQEFNGQIKVILHRDGATFDETALRDFVKDEMSKK
jgi:ferredoxin